MHHTFHLNLYPFVTMSLIIASMVSQNQPTGVPSEASERPKELPPPGVMGRLTEDQRDALLSAVRDQHDLPPNPTGRNQWRVTGPHSGPTSVPGPFRVEHMRNRVAKTYLEEGIMLLHVRERMSLKETAAELGYSYRHVIDTWAAMKKRALCTEKIQEREGDLREFIQLQLEEIIRVGMGRFEENAGYGNLVIRACLVLLEMEDLESGNTSNLDVKALAAIMKGKSPLLLEMVEHAVAEHSKECQL